MKNLFVRSFFPVPGKDFLSVSNRKDDSLINQRRLLWTTNSMKSKRRSNGMLFCIFWYVRFHFCGTVFSFLLCSEPGQTVFLSRFNQYTVRTRYTALLLLILFYFFLFTFNVTFCCVPFPVSCRLIIDGWFIDLVLRSGLAWSGFLGSAMAVSAVLSCYLKLLISRQYFCHIYQKKKFITSLSCYTQKKT